MPSWARLIGWPFRLGPDEFTAHSRPKEGRHPPPWTPASRQIGRRDLMLAYRLPSLINRPSVTALGKSGGAR